MSNGTIYRYDGIDHTSLDAAAQAAKAANGWGTIATSEPFAVGSQEGKRGSVYGVCCYETEEQCAADEEGAHAPRILVIKGDEAWAMGGEEA